MSSNLATKESEKIIERPKVYVEPFARYSINLFQYLNILVLLVNEARIAENLYWNSLDPFLFIIYKITFGEAIILFHIIKTWALVSDCPASDPGLVTS